jgi:hypothetical protein
MAELDRRTTIIVISLGSVLAVLLVLFFLSLLVVLKTKRLLCFKRSGYQRPFLHSDREKRRYTKNHSKGKKKRKPVPGKRTRNDYQSIGRAMKFPKRDPFANKFLENPMVNMDDFDMDWTNPTFDESSALKFEATVAIQSWYRMVR